MATMSVRCCRQDGEEWDSEEERRLCSAWISNRAKDDASQNAIKSGLAYSASLPPTSSPSSFTLTTTSLHITRISRWGRMVHQYLFHLILLSITSSINPLLFLDSGTSITAQVENLEQRTSKYHSKPVCCTFRVCSLGTVTSNLWLDNVSPGVRQCLVCMSVKPRAFEPGTTSNITGNPSPFYETRPNSARICP